jgi:hypothetical protein
MNVKLTKNYFNKHSAVHSADQLDSDSLHMLKLYCATPTATMKQISDVKDKPITSSLMYCPARQWSHSKGLF